MKEYRHALPHRRLGVQRPQPRQSFYDWQQTATLAAQVFSIIYQLLCAQAPQARLHSTLTFLVLKNTYHLQRKAVFRRSCSWFWEPECEGQTVFDTLPAKQCIPSPSLPIVLCVVSPPPVCYVGGRDTYILISGGLRDSGHLVKRQMISFLLLDMLPVAPSYVLTTRFDYPRPYPAPSSPLCSLPAHARETLTSYSGHCLLEPPEGLTASKGLSLSPLPSAFIVHCPAAGQANMTLPITQVCYMLLFLAGGLFFP